MPSVGKDIAHDSAVTHVTGQSQFIDDAAPLGGELVAGIVPAPVACGTICNLDVTAARNVPGVIAILTAADLPEMAAFGPVLHDEWLIVRDAISFLGQPLALVAAETTEALEAAVAAAIVEVQEAEPVLDIDAAIAAESWLSEPRTIACGDLDAGFADADHVLEGSVSIGGQEQFYLESQACLAIPGEQGQMQIHSSTQHTTEVQMLVAEVLGVPFNHVVCTCKRMGGAFGGKETQAAPPAMMAALLARQTGKPVRFVYGKDDDMRYTGKRHPFKSNYRVGFTDDGRITALDVELFANGGCSTDLSLAVLERAMLHTDNAYFLPSMRVVGRVCRTNLPSNTAFRGFGGPQGVASTEHILHEVGRFLGKDGADVRMANVYAGDRNVTPYGMVVQNNVLPKLFKQVRVESDYDTRRAEIDCFNAESPTHVKGLAVSPVKFGISFTRRTLNQANALVNIYLDGSVIVSTGATEMGQGVNTRIRQIVADELGVRFDDVLVTATSTDKNNNTSPTAASAGTDLNGAAATDACTRLRDRLRPVAAELFAKADEGFTAEPAAIAFADGYAIDTRRPASRIAFGDVVRAAYEQRISLGERGFYATPGVDFNRVTGKGNPFLYFTNGVAASEVTVDRFTGEMTVDRVDLIMDVGVSLNPGIDRGQVIGGFVQGMGWCTTEELVYGADGSLKSYSPTTYKIPAISDVPTQLNVRFLDNPDNVISLRRSKAVGEPPLLLGLSVWLAAKDAVASTGSRARVDLPATGERLLLALADPVGAPV